MALPTISDRVDALRNASTRAQLIKDGIKIGHLSKMASMLHPFGMGETPDLDFDRKSSLQQLADAAGCDPVEMYIDRLLASEGRELFNYWAFLAARWKISGNTCSWIM